MRLSEVLQYRSAALRALSKTALFLGLAFQVNAFVPTLEAQALPVPDDPAVDRADPAALPLPTRAFDHPEIGHSFEPQTAVEFDYAVSHPLPTPKFASSSLFAGQNGRSTAASSPTKDSAAGPLHPWLTTSRLRDRLADRGIDLNFEEIYDFQGNPSGGRTQMGTSFGRLTGMLNVDFSKLLGWSGSSLHVNGIFQTGSNLSYTYIGSYDFISSVAGTHSLRLNEYFWKQTFFQSKFTIEGGQIAAQNEFNNQFIGFDDPLSGFKTWVNNTLCCNPPTTVQVHLAFTPAAKPGLLFRLDPTKKIFFKTGVFSGSPSPFTGDESGIRFDLRGAPVAAVSLGYKQGDDSSAHPGVYKVGVITNFGHFHRFQNPDALIHTNSVAFVDLGHALYRRKIDGHFTHQGLDLQFSTSVAPRNLNLNDLESFGGFRYVGLFPNRKADIATLGVIVAHFSSDANPDLIRSGQTPKSYQVNWELGYKYVASKWLAIWPDFQFVQRPSGSKQIADAPIIGLRVVIDF